MRSSTCGDSRWNGEDIQRKWHHTGKSVFPREWFQFRNQFYTDVDKSLMFLNGIAEPSYLGMITNYKMQLSKYDMDPFDNDGKLPRELQLGAIALQMKEQMSNMVEDSSFEFGHVHKTLRRRVNMANGADDDFYLDSSGGVRDNRSKLLDEDGVGRDGNEEEYRGSGGDFQSHHQ